MKRNIYIIIGVIIVVLAIVFISSSDLLAPKNFERVDGITVQLTEEQIQEIEDRIVSTQEEIDGYLELDTFDTIYVAGLYARQGTDEMMLGRLNNAHERYLLGLETEPGYEHIYTRLYNFYLITGHKKLALKSLDQAIEVAPNNSNYWVWKLGVLDEKFNASSSEIESVVNEALEVVDIQVDIYSFYAGYLEKNSDLEGAIEQWENAIEAQPANESIYQAEIDRINSLIIVI